MDGPASVPVGQQSKRALVVSTLPAVAIQLQACGLQVEVYQPYQYCTKEMQTAQTHVRSGHFCFMWLDLPLEREVPTKKWECTLRECALLMESASSSSVPAVLGSWRGKHWLNQAVQALIASGRYVESGHSTCRYDVPHRLSPKDKGDKVAYSLLSTMHISSMRCKCNQTEKKPFNHRQAQAKICQALVQQVIAQVRPDLAREPVSNGHQMDKSEDISSTGQQKRRQDTVLICGEQPRAHQSSVERSRKAVAAFPTEAREKEKQRIKDGHVPKKRKIEVEYHFDDLGDDLSGLGKEISLLAADTAVANSSFLSSFHFLLLFK